MRVNGKLATGLVVLALVFSTAPVANTTPSREPSPTNTITLVTGDRVTMRGDAGISIRPGAGREKVTFSRFSAGGHLYVFPDDARRLIGTGRLDRRLFDIPTLIEFGYDDAHRDTLPLIVTHPAGRDVPRAGRVARALPSVNGVALTVDKAGAGAAWEALTDGGATRTMADGVSTVWLDGKRKTTLDRSAAQIGAPAAWDAGVTGAGVTVAVLDTGVDQTHPDLADREVAERNFTDAPDNADTIGHGTHVASIVAGTGAKSGGRYRGVAHGAAILDGKVFNHLGFGFDSWIIAAMEWAAQQGADIANMSLGSSDTTAIDPLEQAVETLTAQHGILFVIAAGNSGPSEHSMSSPGSAPSALTVGAVDRDDTLAEFSSRGPTEQAGVLKPDITAPGVGIVAALHSAGTAGDPVADGYMAASGTSMAAPHVAGAAALIAQQHPDWTGQQLKAALSASARPAPNLTVFAQGAGRVDVARALRQSVVTEPAGVHVGTVAWPHDDDVPVSKTVTYHNLGAAEVTLDLSVAATGPDGAPAAVFSLSAEEVTVPAGGQAAVTVTGDTNLGTVDGHYSGAITATEGDSVIRTPVVVTREVESYDLTLNFLDENGSPTSDYSSFVAGLDVARFVDPYDSDGSETVRLPKGRYAAQHSVITGQGTHHNFFVQPGIVLDRDTTVEVDPAVTRPISITPPAAATLELLEVGYLIESGGEFITGGIGFGSAELALSTAQLDDPLPEFPVNALVSSHWSGADGAYYGLAWPVDGYPTGLTKSPLRRELATVRAEIGRGAPGDMAERVKTVRTAAGVPGLPFFFPVPIPGTSTEYVTTEGLNWASGLLQFAEDGRLNLVLDSPWLSLRPGRTYDAPINHPVFGPGLPPSDFPWVSRSGDTIVAFPPLFTDRHGNASIFSRTESGSTKLYLGDRLIGESPEAGFGVFPGLPPAPGEYRLTTEATRSHTGLSTSVSAEWTFESSQVDDETPLELNVVRFAPRLDANGGAPAGQPFLVPLRVQDETGANIRPRQISVEVSYDEGRTWQGVPVTNNLVAKLRHPAGATSVSLRASATDKDGNTITQTLIRAYLLR